MADSGAVARVDRGGRPRDPGNDTAILDAALDLLIERGAAGTSIEAIARRAEVAKLTVYRRWHSKEELLLAALEHARNPDPDHPQAANSLDEVVEHTAELLSQPRFRALMARVIGASVDHPRLVHAYTTRYLQPRLAALADTAQRAIDAGSFPPDTDPTAIQDILTSSIGFALLHNGGDTTAEQIKHRLHTMLRQMGYRASSS
ncbi:TetR/AcrR family transcriptional regulator [Micromonospora arborensis]|uniref:TetR/AcrR family transcriptional regulator n=1 Tax=Micromonospora arborensis TaxID=2116518 RepID=UPI0033CD4ED6